MAGYIPGGEGAFNAGLENFITYTTANLANLGLVAGVLVPVPTVQTASNSALTAHVTSQQAATSATQQKNADRTAAVRLVRALVGRLQARSA